MIIGFAIFGIAASLEASIHRVGVEAYNDGSAWVVVNGRKAIHLRTSNGTLKPLDRAKIVEERLSAFVKKPVDPKAIGYKQVGRTAHVLIGQSLLLIATEAEAKTRNLPPMKLAETWVQNLRKLLTLPPLAVEPASLLVPLEETRAIAVQTFLKDPIHVEVSNPLVISIDTEARPGAIVVTGLSVGSSTMDLKCGEFSVSVSVSVKKFAAKASTDVRKAVVTGTNVSAPMVSLAASDAATQALELEPGARIRSKELQSPVRGVAPGSSLNTVVLVEAAGGDHIPVKLPIPVQVENRHMTRVPTSWIMYSNHPESVRKFQTLFAGKIESHNCAYRLLYHHQNMMGRRMGFTIELVNPSDSPASFHVIEGVSRPMLDTVVVGYVAGLDFLENHRSYTGRVMELPPRTRRVLVTQAIEAPHTASGIIDLRQITGGPLLLRVIAKPDDQRASEDVVGVPIDAPGVDFSKVTLSDQVYPEPVRQLDVTYTCGKQWAFIRIGKEHLKHATQDKLLYGNYGVIYDINATLENPFSEPMEIEYVFDATAGPASGLFIVDGELVRVKYHRPPSEIRIGKTTVPAGRSKKVNIKTLPLSGSAYPATIVIRQVSSTRAAAVKETK